MFQLVDRSEIDDERWNALVQSSDHFRHYALTYFLDATCDQWKALIWDDYRVVWPLPVKTRPAAQLYQPLLAQQLGPYPPERLDASELESAWRWLEGRYWKLNVKFNDHFRKIPMAHVPHTNVELELLSSSKGLEAGYNRNVRSNVRKAQEAGLTFRKEGAFDSKWIRVFRQSRGGQIDVLDDAFYQHVANIYQAFELRNEAETWVASKGAQALGAVMLLTTNDRLQNLLTASTPEARDCGAMHGLFDAIIQHYAGQNKTLDFEGSDDEKLAFFYRSFGGVERVYLQATSGVHLPWLKRF